MRAYFCALIVASILAFIPSRNAPSKETRYKFVSPNYKKVYPNPSVMAHQPRSFLSNLGTSLESRVGQRYSNQQQVLGRFLGHSQLTVAKKAAQIVPGFVPALGQDKSLFRTASTGSKLVQHGADLYVAPYAMEKFFRQIYILHSAGICHNNISPENIVVTPTGELQLIDWSEATFGGNTKIDQLGLESVRSFLRHKVGMGG